MKKIIGYGLLIVFTLIFGFSISVQAGDNILIAAASNLRFAMHEICQDFQEENSSIHTKVAYGSSGNFFAQIKQGAPFDIFFSADTKYPELLEKDGLTAKETQKVYAVGKIVLWVPKGSKVDFDKGLQAVISSRVTKLTIANPRHAPYGRAAAESLRYYGLWEKVKGKLIYGENISQTAQFVHTGAADAGIIALSLAISPRMLNDGKYWEIPDGSYSDIEQVYVVLKKGEGKKSIRKFLDFIHGERGGKILSRYGFVILGAGESRS
ncbi:MAG: molybdate ABC transporter substrate-binding protein [Candidatus Scalindua rubra]|uniref:Molybdenum ABC transporter substrate binding component n=1 Tax=Candidatus Scalindua brodae TaxID=237368 RepID=A0A0B0EIZ9_9BACT|nr:MAG: molybdenum ABC transporter substrate binding component [Candidatus Scalindua brodae]MBZ0110648.1 molybdate ABC transporter substrate-binding protein [Candidatus Scalindua rubra]TWU28931.1 Molybdate-binding periplasmic protein precursor [Candidatus Brocadiaceae bacterium S225]